MLSRVAENIYWMARYIERAENTARIVNVNANLLLDLPSGIAPGWGPLIAITGGEQLFRSLYDSYDETDVVRFLVGDTHNYGSILSTLAYARENARTIRDRVPREAWEELNELYFFAHDHVEQGLSKRGRYEYLKRIMRGAHTLAGLFMGAMNHDAGYEFMRLGRFIERADMTTRIIDVRSASLLTEGSGLKSFENIQWMSVLKSLTGYQMYRQKMQVRVQRAPVLKFLLQDAEFPRAFFFCVNEAEGALSRLPRNSEPLRIASGIGRGIREADLSKLPQEQLQTYIDQLQLKLAGLNDGIARQYFLAPE